MTAALQPVLFAPDAVVMARSTEEVVFIVRHCAESGVPVIPYGAGTSLEGYLAAVRGRISVDLSQMDRVLRVGAEDMDCTVQAGVTREALNTHLRDQGLFFPIDPGANAPLGGMVSTRASGTNAVRYGTMREVTLSLPDGEVIRAASRARKSAAGCDLTRLFVGAEGRLGTVTEITLRLSGIPQAISAALCSFLDVDSAVAAATMVTKFGVPVARMKLMDRSLIEAVDQHAGLSLPVADTLAFEFHWTEAAVAEQATIVSEIMSDFEALVLEASTDPEERARLWKARHNAWHAVVGTEKVPWLDVGCVRAGVGAEGMHPPCARSSGQLSGARRDFGACGRRQLPRRLRHRSRPARGDGRSQAHQRRDGGPRHFRGRDLHGGAWGGVRQGRLSA